MKRIPWLILIVAMLAPAGCGKSAPGGGAFGAFDPAASLKALEGNWKVNPGPLEQNATWKISGDKVSITKADGEKVEGTLAINAPGSLALKDGSMTSYYSYAKTADGLYIGLGGSGQKIGDTWYVMDSFSRGLVTYNGTKCQFRKQKMSFGKDDINFEEPKDVTCSIADEGGKKVFKFQVPKFMKDGELDDKSLNVVGDWLLGGQLLSDHKVEAAE